VLSFITNAFELYTAVKGSRIGLRSRGYVGFVITMDVFGGLSLATFAVIPLTSRYGVGPVADVLLGFMLAAS
jgi:hypothetical protein